MKQQNFVNKNMIKLCRNKVHRDKKNDYSRKVKHKKPYI